MSGTRIKPYINIRTRPTCPKIFPPRVPWDAHLLINCPILKMKLCSLGVVTWSHRVCDSKNLTQRDCYLGPGAQLGPQGKTGGRQEERKQAFIQHLQGAGRQALRQDLSKCHSDPPGFEHSDSSSSLCNEGPSPTSPATSGPDSSGTGFIPTRTPVTIFKTHYCTSREGLTPSYPSFSSNRFYIQ